MSFSEILISEEFSAAIEKAFEKSSNHVRSTVRAYYVYIDIKAGYALREMIDYRIKPFCYFLYNYTLKNKSDFLSLKLLKLVDDIIISRISHKVITTNVFYEKSREELCFLYGFKDYINFNGRIEYYASLAKRARIVVDKEGTTLMNYVFMEKLIEELKNKHNLIKTI